MTRIPAWYASPGRTHLHGVPEGFDALALAASARAVADQGRSLLFVARDDTRQAQMLECLGFFAPDIQALSLPAWDCLPYDRVSPNPALVAERLQTLCALADAPQTKQPRAVITTVNAVLQRLPARAVLRGASFTLKVGDLVDLNDLTGFFTRNGYSRTDTVREAGEFALRGGIVDVCPPGGGDPVRFDLFGEQIDAIRSFDPMTQRSTGTQSEVRFLPAGEIILDEAAIARFRSGYRGLFGAEVTADPLYEAVSTGRRQMGMEHWLPLFHETLETIADYLPLAPVAWDDQVEEAVAARLEQIEEYYDARRSAMRAARQEGAPYRPLPADRLYLSRADWPPLFHERPLTRFAGTVAPPGPDRADAGVRPGRSFGDVRAGAATGGPVLLDAVVQHVKSLLRGGKRVIITAQGPGSRERLGALLAEHGLGETAAVENWPLSQTVPSGIAALAVLALERGFEGPDVAVLTEADIFGDKLIRQPRRRKAANFIAEAASLAEGDLVVHVEHGIAKYDGLETLTVGGAPHDCLRLIYAGGDKLYVPVENIEVLSRFGSEDAEAQLDKLGGAGWQARKAKVKQRIRDIAAKLIAIAAEREIRTGELLQAPSGIFEEFCARFPYAETDDQLRAIEDVLTDLAAGKPMDRLVCGDVGFGKTEVAMRAACVAVLAGFQVAVVVPTTLLARQHHRGFSARFAGLPVQVGTLSRLVTAKDAAKVKAGLADGTLDLVVGTHAVLAKGVEFARLGLLIVDEEQHFGVGQKEKLKELKSDVHVLTLTATPIPRTLQLALSGVRDMSIIATPPVDRLAVRTFITPYDPVVLREAIMREHFRGGQMFYVCPRIEDLDLVAERVRKLAPEIKFRVAHGKLSPTALEDTMSAFIDGQFDMLISTNIVESGLDIPRANTLFVHRADMFGLGQLYQLRGRVGRSKTRAYCYLTLPPDKVLTETAQKRLTVMQTLDQLGAGFQLASHDLDIRGAGNLLGDEQSGHIREVGIELYQQMLADAVAAARARAKAGETAALESGADDWSPQITLGAPVMIPDAYVADLGIRLQLYRRAATLADRSEIDSFAAELIDRFGPLPSEVNNLLEIIEIKRLCRDAGVDRLDAGPKGAVIGFRGNKFANPAALVKLIGAQAGTVKLRPDHKLVYMRIWELPKDRVAGVRKILDELAKLAAGHAYIPNPETAPPPPPPAPVKPKPLKKALPPPGRFRR